MTRATIKPLTPYEQKMLDDMLNGPVIDNRKKLQALIFTDVTDFMHNQSKLLDDQFKKELSKIKFRGEITRKKLKRHGFLLVHQTGVGTYITKNGVRVTDIFFKPYEL
jgi:hypothetical protein